MEEMKKKSLYVLIMMLTLVSVLTACSNTSTQEPAEDSYDWKEYLELAEYKGLPYYTEEASVTEEEVEAQIESILLYATETETVTEGVVEDGDTINVAFVGKIDGEEFEGGSSESYDITVGTTSMIDGFVEGLVGKNIGETVTLNLRFPDEYPNNTELQGKDVVFDVTINSKKISITPELTDEFVQNYYEMETVDELRESIREDLKKDKEATTKSTIQSSLWDIILQNSVLKATPESEEEYAQGQVDSILEEYHATADSYGVEWADFLTTFLGTDEAGLQEMMDDYKENLTKSNITTKAIANSEGLTLSDSAYKERIKEILENNSLTEETFQSYYNMTVYEYADQNGWRDNILQEMVMDKIMELGNEVSKEEFDKYVSDNLVTEDTTDGDTEE